MRDLFPGVQKNLFPGGLRDLFHTSQKRLRENCLPSPSPSSPPMSHEVAHGSDLDGPSGSGQSRHHNTRSKEARAQGRPEGPAAGGGRSAAVSTAGRGVPVGHSRVAIAEADANAPSSDEETFLPARRNFSGRAASRYVFPCECAGGWSCSRRRPARLGSCVVALTEKSTIPHRLPA